MKFVISLIVLGVISGVCGFYASRLARRFRWRTATEILIGCFVVCTLIMLWGVFR